MANPELLIISILRALTEVALLTLLGQGLLALLAGGRRETNPVYRVFKVITGCDPGGALHHAPTGDRPAYPGRCIFPVVLAVDISGLCQANTMRGEWTQLSRLIMGMRKS